MGDHVRHRTSAFSATLPTGEEGASTASSWSRPGRGRGWPASARRRTSTRPRASNPAPDKPSMETVMPRPMPERRDLRSAGGAYRDMQGSRVHHRENKLWMLQTPQRQAHPPAPRSRSPATSSRRASSAKRRPIGRVEPQAPRPAPDPTIDPKAERDLLAPACRPRPARPRARSCSTSEAARGGQRRPGAKCIPVPFEPLREEIHGTARRRGDPPPPRGMTSHAAVSGAAQWAALRLRFAGIDPRRRQGGRR